MCWLLVKPAGKVVPEKYIDQAVKHNKDGFGISYMADTLQVYKTLDLTEFKTKLSTLDDIEAIIHLRAASIGGVSASNIHPFKTASGVMFHNGTIQSFRGKTDKCPTSGCLESDTKALADLIAACTYNKLSDIQPLVQHIITKTSNKLAFHENDGSITIMNKHLGQEEDGIWYSNDYHIEPDYTYDSWWEQETDPNKTAVFVYGTLKQGHTNHAILGNSKFLGKAKTVVDYFMIGEDMPFPYVLNASHAGPLKYRHKAKAIIGEMYEVDNFVLAKLDRLEGVPTHYKKTTVYARYVETGQSVLGTMYIKAAVNEALYEKKMLEEWRPEAVSGTVVYEDADISIAIAKFLKEVEETTFFTKVELETFTSPTLEGIYDEFSILHYGEEQPFYTRPTSTKELIEEILWLTTEIQEEADALAP